MQVKNRTLLVPGIHLRGPRLNFKGANLLAQDAAFMRMWLGEGSIGLGRASAAEFSSPYSPDHASGSWAHTGPSLVFL